MALRATQVDEDGGADGLAVCHRYTRLQSRWASAARRRPRLQPSGP